MDCVPSSILPNGLAPVYDLLPIDRINSFRTTSINDKVEPAREDLIAVAVKSGLDEKEAIHDFEMKGKFLRE